MGLPTGGWWGIGVFLELRGNKINSRGTLFGAERKQAVKNKQNQLGWPPLLEV